MPDPIHDVDIKLLRIFGIVAEKKSFTLAAEALNTSPSNISMNMTQLEGRLNMRLCERGVKGFKLTEQGKKVLEASAELSGALMKFRDKVGIVADSNQSELRIGILAENFFENKLQIPALIAHLESSLPNVSLYLEYAPAAVLKESLDKDELHCIIAYFENLPSTFEVRTLFTESHLCYCSKKHALYELDDEAISIETMQDFKIAGYDDMAEDEKRIVPLFEKFDSCSRTNEGILNLILSGYYIGLMPKSFAQHWIDAGEIRAIAIPGLELKVDIKLASKKSRGKELALQSILDGFDKFYP